MTKKLTPGESIRHHCFELNSNAEQKSGPICNLSIYQTLNLFSCDLCLFTLWFTQSGNDNIFMSRGPVVLRAFQHYTTCIPDNIKHQHSPVGTGIWGRSLVGGIQRTRKCCSTAVLPTRIITTLGRVGNCKGSGSVRGFTIMLHRNHTVHCTI